MAADDIDKAIESIGWLTVARRKSPNAVKGTIEYAVSVNDKNFFIIHD
jgi:hypothetical protein